MTSSVEGTWQLGLLGVNEFTNGLVQLNTPRELIGNPDRCDEMVSLVPDADLVDVSAFSQVHRGHKYMMTCSDVFSKFAWASPHKKKTGNDIVGTFRSILKARD